MRSLVCRIRESSTSAKLSKVHDVGNVEGVESVIETTYANNLYVLRIIAECSCISCCMENILIEKEFFLTHFPARKNV